MLQFRLLGLKPWLASAANAVARKPRPLLGFVFWLGNQDKPDGIIGEKSCTVWVLESKKESSGSFHHMAMLLTALYFIPQRFLRDWTEITVHSIDIKDLTRTRNTLCLQNSFNPSCNVDEQVLSVVVWHFSRSGSLLCTPEHPEKFHWKVLDFIVMFIWPPNSFSSEHGDIIILVYRNVIIFHTWFC